MESHVLWFAGDHTKFKLYNINLIRFALIPFAWIDGLNTIGSIKRIDYKMINTYSM